MWSAGPGDGVSRTGVSEWRGGRLWPVSMVGKGLRKQSLFLFFFFFMSCALGVLFKKHVPTCSLIDSLSHFLLLGL